MPTPFKALLFILSLLILSFSITAQEKSFDIETLINTIPFDDVIENDEITADQLHKLLSKNAHKNDTIWRLDKHNKSTIIFHSPHEKWILKTYPMSKNKQLLLVNTQLGNHGQTQSFIFYIYNRKENSLSKEMQRNAYIPDITENDFLSKAHKFTEKDQGNVVLSMNDDGTISASPMQWMSEKWKNKEPEYTIKLKWVKNHFIKIKEKI